MQRRESKMGGDKIERSWGILLVFGEIEKF